MKFKGADGFFEDRKGNQVKLNFPILCSLLLLCPAFAEDKRPNVVTLLVDDLGYRDLGCLWGPVKTPVLDKLAAGGVRFTDFHSGAPSCSPRVPLSLRAATTIVPESIPSSPNACTRCTF